MQNHTLIIIVIVCFVLLAICEKIYFYFCGQLWDLVMVEYLKILFLAENSQTMK